MREELKKSLSYKRHRRLIIWILCPNSSSVLIVTSQGYFYQCCSTTIIVYLNFFIVSRSPYKPCKSSLGQLELYSALPYL